MIQKTSRAITFLRSTARNSPWLVIAVSLHVVLLASLAFVQLTSKDPNARDVPTNIVVARRPDLDSVVPPEPPIVRNFIPERRDDDVELTDVEIDWVPTQTDIPEDLHDEAGDVDQDPADFGPPQGGSSAIGPGLFAGVQGPPGSRGGGGGFGPGGKRFTHGGTRRVEATERTEKSVLEGLRWLIRHQQANGSWSPVGMGALCSPGTPCIASETSVSANYDEGLTGLALLAFLGAGLGHDSKIKVVDTAMAKRYRVGTVVKNGLQWLVQRQHDDGSFSASGFVYNEALATMAMCEAYGLTRERRWKEPARKGVDFLVRAQRRSAEDGSRWGWRYASAERIDADHAAGKLDDATFAHEISDSDLSATCWAVMALKSAQLAQLELGDEVDAALLGGLAFARSVATDDGRAGYVDRAGAGEKVPGKGDHFTYHPGTMTALDMLTRTFVERDLGDPYLELGAKQLAQDLPSVSRDHLSVDYYYWYYATLALDQFDGPDSPRKSGKYWTPWNEAMQGSVLALQDKNAERDVCSRGGWLVDDRWSHAGHSIYNTAINTLTLEVYYRYENAFGAKLIDKLDTRGTDSKFVASPSAAPADR